AKPWGHTTVWKLPGPECNCLPPLAATAVSCRCEVPHPWRATLAHPLTRSQSDVVGKGSQGKRGCPALMDTGASTVTCRPHAGAAGAAEQANKRLGRLPMRGRCFTAVDRMLDEPPKSIPIDKQSDDQIEYMLSRIPMGRFGQTTEIAALVAWLASEECSFSTGGVFDISGGRATY